MRPLTSPTDSWNETKDKFLVLVRSQWCDVAQWQFYDNKVKFGLTIEYKIENYFDPIWFMKQMHQSDQSKHVKSHTSEWSSCIISYMSRSTNNFSGDLLLLAIASPKLSSIETLFVVTSAKHCSLSESKPSNIWSQTFLSPANNNFTCSCIIT